MCSLASQHVGSCIIITTCVCVCVQGAIDAYTECLALDPTNENPSFTSKLFCNRAAAYLKLTKNEEAYNDCSKCIELDESYSKAYIRRAQAGLAIGDLEHLETAVRDFQKAKTLTAEGGEGEVSRELDKGLKEAKGKLKKARRKDYYKILDVGKDANEDDLKKAYRKMCLKFHPDRHATAEDEDRKKAEATFKVRHVCVVCERDRGLEKSGMRPHRVMFRVCTVWICVCTRVRVHPATALYPSLSNPFLLVAGRF